MACWYRPPLRNDLKIVDQDEKEIMLAGGSNCDFKWNHNSRAKKLEFVCFEFQLELLMMSYTRVATICNEGNGAAGSRTFIDDFSSNRQKYTLKVDRIETGIYDLWY